MDIVEQLRKPRDTANGIQVGECYGCYDKQRAEAGYNACNRLLQFQTLTTD